MIIYVVFVHTYYTISLIGAYETEEKAKDYIKKHLKDYNKKCVIKIVALDVSKPVYSKTYKMIDDRLVVI